MYWRLIPNIVEATALLDRWCPVEFLPAPPPKSPEPQPEQDNSVLSSEEFRQMILAIWKVLRDFPGANAAVARAMRPFMHPPEPQ